MNADTTKELQNKLNDIIYMISKELLDKDGVRKTVLNLKDIYVDGFRHLYSEFFPIVAKIFREDEYTIEYLLTNLEQIRDYAEKDFIKDDRIIEIYQLNCIRKLFDHIHLEAVRLNYAINTPDLNDAKSKLIEAEIKIDEADKKLNEATKKLNNSHGQIVAVLSIFAAIVLTFAGGIGLIGSAITAIVNAPVLKLILVILAAGLVLIDAITALLYSVSRIVNKSIFAKCEKIDCNQCDTKCKGLTKIRKRLPFIFWINVVLFASLILITALCILNNYYGFI